MEYEKPKEDKNKNKNFYDSSKNYNFQNYSGGKEPPKKPPAPGGAGESDDEFIRRTEERMRSIEKMRENIVPGEKHEPTIGLNTKWVSSTNHSGSWTPEGFDEPIKSDDIRVTTGHSDKDDVISFSLRTLVPRSTKIGEIETKDDYELAKGSVYPNGTIDLHPQSHPALPRGTIDEKAVKFILTDHFRSKVKHPETGEIYTVGEHHGLKNSLIEEWTQKYKKSIDCSNPKGFSQRAHCQGRKKKLNEDLRRWFKEKWTAQDGSKCGDYKGRGRVKCRPSKRVSEKSPETWGEMSPKEKKKAVRLKQKAHREGKQFSSHKSGKTWDGPKNKYKPGKKKVNEMYEHVKQLFLERKAKREDCGCGLNEEKKPYKGFKKGKNHPEGGLSRAEARRQGIHAGIETKDEAKRKGGFGKLSSKTQKRRKSFCARMCGMKRRRTSSKTARDPKSKINAALRVWGCRCGTNESYELNSAQIILEKRGSCWEGYKQNGMKKKNGKMVPNCVPMNESIQLNEGKNKPTDKKLWSRAKALARQKFKVYPSAYANAWAAKWYKKRGGGWSSMQTESIIHNVVEEVVNKRHKGSMTEKEIAARDSLAKRVKGIRPIKGKDSEKNARYRYATYVILRKRGGEGSKSSPKGSKSKKSKQKKNKS